jgi:hypothetical protein
MTFWQEFSDGYESLNTKVGDGLKAGGTYVWNRLQRINSINDHLADAADKTVTAATDVVGNVTDLLSGKSNILLYVGIGVLAIVVLPVVLQKVL